MIIINKLITLLFISFLSLNVFSQIKTCTYEKYGLMSESTHNYAIPIDNKLIISRDKNNLFTIKIHDSDLTKAPIFTLSKIHLNSYDEFRERYIYIGDANREGAANGKCMIISIYKLDSYLGDKGKEDDNYLNWDKRLSFTIYLKNLRFINEMEEEEYLRDIFMTIFPLKNKIKTALELEFEQKEKILIEKRVQEQKENDIKEIKEILSKLDIETKVSQVKIEREERYKSILKDKMINLSADELLTYTKGFTTTMSLNEEFILNIDKNKDILVISDDEYNSFNKTLQLKDNYAKEYNIGGNIYYKFNDDIFSENYKIKKEISLEIQTFGVNLRNGKFKYYTNQNNIFPKIVENWCTENIKTNGLYFINYMIIDGELVCRILNFDRETKEYLKQRFKIGLLNKY